jgi:hypothetical protein
MRASHTTHLKTDEHLPMRKIASSIDTIYYFIERRGLQK